MSEAWLNREINAYKQREKDRKKKEKQYRDDCKKLNVKDCDKYVSDRKMWDVWDKRPGDPGYLKDDGPLSPDRYYGDGVVGAGRKTAHAAVSFISANRTWFLIGGGVLVVFFLLR